MKIVIVINGKGGSGKDTLCDVAARRHAVTNVSAITPIKRLAREYGWRGEKDNRSRRFLSDLKRAFSDYCDLPNRYLLGECEAFMQGGKDILFAHIREPDQIAAFASMVPIRCVTLLVRQARLDRAEYGNASDDEVEGYPYDYIYDNDKPIAEVESDFLAFLEALLAAEGALETDDAASFGDCHAAAAAAGAAGAGDGVSTDSGRRDCPNPSSGSR